ncbi:hypothetical protein [Saccharomonospora sp.]|uniref:hypothetical protein n=1 Tax=Saccharomonospora sp. TaxID=33913 RepID=UPI002622A9CA|nr:hypothetical protein [Saccharomonospora sp.]
MGLFDGVEKTLQKNLNDVLASRGMVPLHELVRRIHEGDASKWHEAATKADSVVQAHQDASERSRKMLQVLESSWTGEGADAAANKIRMGAKAAEISADVYAANARQYTDSAYAFDNIKQQLPSIAESPPERGFVDVLTPWDTDTEKQINQHKADVERARQIYEGYEQAMQSAQQSVVKDFGPLDSLDTFDSELGTIERDESGSAKSSGTGIRTFNEPDSSLPAGPSVSGGSSIPSPVSGSVPGGSTQTPSFQTPSLPGSSQPNDSTSASGYVPPEVSRPAPGYAPPNLNPSTGFGPGSGGSGTPNTPGFGSIGAPGGFGPAGGSSTVGGVGGRFSAPGIGGVPGGAGGVAGGGAGGAAPGVGAGRGTGAVPFGPAGSGGPGAVGGPAGGASGAAAGRGAMPMGAMGGAGRGGQGSEDQEHQRQYVQATDEAFLLTEDGEVLRDPTTGHAIAPPTIGG